MKNNNVLYIGLIILLIIFGVYFNSSSKNSLGNNSNNASSTIVVATSTQKTTTVKKPTTYNNNYLWSGRKLLINGVDVTPGKVAYDSRCPIDVKCIQAGTIELGVLLENGTQSQNVIITLDKPFPFAGKMVTLTNVSPSRVSGKTINPVDYRFLITVK